ncbi:hypothetical protein WR25_14864 isoform B [Diploscapter pachys]|uniref:F-box domain-containing protein n=1 Tax=Diploscapter pachys TaxID=2018661 RepID=A0A2A2KNA4_9BILA|nr:hypothetical protein WR25_14864 isoform B [Diploscapter pachys]
MDDDSFDEEPVIQTETLGIPMQVLNLICRFFSPDDYINVAHVCSSWRQYVLEKVYSPSYLSGKDLESIGSVTIHAPLIRPTTVLVRVERSRTDELNRKKHEELCKQLDKHLADLNVKIIKGKLRPDAGQNSTDQSRNASPQHAPGRQIKGKGKMVGPIGEAFMPVPIFDEGPFVDENGHVRKPIDKAKLYNQNGRIVLVLPDGRQCNVISDNSGFQFQIAPQLKGLELMICHRSMAEMQIPKPSEKSRAIKALHINSAKLLLTKHPLSSISYNMNAKPDGFLKHMPKWWLQRTEWLTLETTNLTLVDIVPVIDLFNNLRNFYVTPPNTNERRVHWPLLFRALVGQPPNGPSISDEREKMEGPMRHFVQRIFGRERQQAMESPADDEGLAFLIPNSYFSKRGLVYANLKGEFSLDMVLKFLAVRI